MPAYLIIICIINLSRTPLVGHRGNQHIESQVQLTTLSIQRELPPVDKGGPVARGHI